MSDSYDARRARAIREVCSRVVAGDEPARLEAVEWSDEQRQVHICCFDKQRDSNGYRLVCVVADRNSGDAVGDLLMDLSDARRELAQLRRQAQGVSDE
jgi:hypothetical protein